MEKSLVSARPRAGWRTPAVVERSCLIWRSLIRGMVSTGRISVCPNRWSFG